MLVSKSLQDTSYITVGSHVLEMKNKMLNSLAYCMKKIIQRCWLLFKEIIWPICYFSVELGGFLQLTSQLSDGSVFFSIDSELLCYIQIVFLGLELWKQNRFINSGQRFSSKNNLVHVTFTMIDYFCILFTFKFLYMTVNSGTIPAYVVSINWFS